ncbi:MAG: UbiA family prenyltransferase [candidate division WOR-3 bacterium]|nr:MAG: UbiA family prenyltransferase [candidate division WOR-3 bacterium]
MAYLRIIRPVNCVIASVSVLVGAWIGRDIFLSNGLIAAAIIGFMVCAFGNLVNDIKDIEIDRINNPTRPLPSGKVKKNIIWLMAFAFMMCSATASFFLGTFPFLVVIAALILLLFYSVYLKKTLFGNLAVALISGLSFILGGLVAGNAASLVPLIFSIFIHMPREILKDVMDMRGDRMIGAITLPIMVGTTQAYNISAIFLSVLCLMLPIPYIIGILDIVYIIIVLAVAYPILIYIIWRLVKKPSVNALPLVSNLIKASMIVGLAAMIAS